MTTIAELVKAAISDSTTAKLTRLRRDREDLKTELAEADDTIGRHDRQVRYFRGPGERDARQAAVEKADRARAAREQLVARDRRLEREEQHFQDQLVLEQRARAVHAAFGGLSPRVDPVPTADLDTEYRARRTQFVHAFRLAAIACEEFVAVCAQLGGTAPIEPPSELRAFDDESVFRRWMARELAVPVSAASTPPRI